MKLILIRHGETEKNVKGKLHSAQDSESLNETGKEQLLVTAKAIKEYAPTTVYSSHENRAIQSGKLLAEALSLPFEQLDGLEERNWGVFSGRPWSDVSEVLSPMSLEERYEYIPENGESWKTFETRLIKAIDSAIAKNNGKNIVVVSHGGAIRALMPYLLGVPKEESFKYDPDNASITAFEWNGQSFSKIVVNDTSHLSVS